MADEASITVTIMNRLGLHARPAMVFVDTANSFASEISVSRCDRPEEVVDGKSIMQMMMLAAVQGTDLCVRAAGEDRDAALAALKKVVEDGFGE